MKKLMLHLLMLLVAFQSEAQTADQIIDKHIAAAGGRDKWNEVKSIRYSGNYIMGPGMLAPVVEGIWSSPKAGYYSEFTWQSMSSKAAMLGDSGWNYNPFGGKRESDPMSPNEIRMNKLSSNPQGLLLNYKALGYSVDYLGTDDMDGSEVYKLRLTTPGGDLVYYFIDAETYYILKVNKKVKLKDKEEKSTNTFSDYRKNAFGIVVPHMQGFVNEDGSEGGVILYDKVEVNIPFDPKLFERPMNK